MAGVEETLIDPTSEPRRSRPTTSNVAQCAADIQAARERGASVMYIYGAHLIKNGAHQLLDALMADAGSRTSPLTAPA